MHLVIQGTPPPVVKIDRRLRDPSDLRAADDGTKKTKVNVQARVLEKAREVGSATAPSLASWGESGEDSGSGERLPDSNGGSEAESPEALFAEVTVGPTSPIVVASALELMLAGQQRIRARHAEPAAVGPDFRVPSPEGYAAFV